MLHVVAEHVDAERDVTYGSWRLCIELSEQGFNAGQSRVCQIMKPVMLAAKRPGCHCSPQNGTSAVMATNLLKRHFNPATLNTCILPVFAQLRVGYIWPLSWTCVQENSELPFSDKPDNVLTLRTLRLAVDKRRSTGRAVFHSIHVFNIRAPVYSSAGRKLM